MARIPSTREGLAYLLNGQPAAIEAVMRGLAVKGALPQFLDPDVQLGVNVLDTTAFEFRWARRSQTFEQGVNLAAGGAGNIPTIFLQTNSTTPRAAMALLESFYVTNNGAAVAIVQWGIAQIASGAATGAACAPADDRQFAAAGGNVRGNYMVGGNAAIAVANNPLNGVGAPVVTLGVNQTLYVPGPWVLTQKDNGTVSAAFYIVGLTANQPLQAALRWRERELLASEQ